MQAPQKSQLDSSTRPPAPKAMRVEKPRPASVIAPVWRSSSQARTQRVQMMHIFGSNSRNGLARSAGGGAGGGEEQGGSPPHRSAWGLPPTPPAARPRPAEVFW